ncbi:MAG: hypothetical protein ABSA39_11615 [Edaphobacter sp.]
MENPQQQDSFKSRWLSIGRASIVLATFLLTLRFGKYVLATPHFISDDESYLLLSLKHYFAGEHLYTQVFSMYGPFYFLLQKAIFGLFRLPVSFDSGRLVAYIYWVLSAVFGGLFVYRLSKNALLASAACLATMWLERVISLEPNHPQEVVIVLQMLGCCISANPSPAALLSLGAVGTALFFTKTNIGIFFLAAAVIASVCVFPEGRLRNMSSQLLFAAVVAGPIVLMHHFLNAWAWGFCLMSILAGTSTLLAGMRANVYASEGMKTFRYIALGAIGFAILTLLATTMEGLSLRTVLDGVILAPSRQPAVFFIPFVVTKEMLMFGIVLAVCVAGLYWFPERWRTRSAWIDVLKCVAGVLVIVLLDKRTIAYMAPRTFSFAPLYALLPLVLIPRKEVRWKAVEYFPRIFIAALAVMLIMQAYSVAGSQVNSGVAPFLLWAFVCIHDGGGGLLASFPSTKGWHVRISAASVLGGIVLVILTAGMLKQGIWHRHYPTPASSLAGSASLHLPIDLETYYGAVSNDAQTNCQILFTMPGMGSFNFWSEVPTPDGFNEDNWMRGIPLEKQQKTLQVLEANPSACVITRPSMLPVWGVPDDGIDSLPLARYIRHDMPTVFARWGYEIHVSPNRRVPWVERSTVTAP